MNKTGSPAATFAYPFGEGSENQAFAFDVQDSVATHHIAGRGVYSYNLTSFPYDFAPTTRDYYKLATLSGVAENWHSMVDQCTQEGGILPLMYHGVNAQGVFENISLEDFSAQLDYLTAKGDSIWITTLEQAIKYHRERKGAILTETSAPFAETNNWTLNLSDTVRNDWYDFPLSIKLTIPESITAIVAIAQNNEQLDFTVEGAYVYFNAIPDGGDINIDILNCEQADAELSITGDQTFCLPDSTNFTLPYNLEYAYTWYKNNVEFATDTNSISVMESGTYHAKVIWNDCPIITDKTDITVTGTCGIPETNFTIDRSVQFKDTPLFYTSTSDNLEGDEKYFWDFGVGASLAPGYYGPGPVEVAYNISGNKDVTLTVEGRVDNNPLTITNIVQIEDYSACHAFQNDFTNGHNPNFLSSWNNYSFNSVNNALRITTKDDGGHQWYTIDYAFNDGDIATTIDFSEPLVEPILKMRIKASDTCRVSISLVDENGVATVGSLMNNVGGLDITAEYQDFELNMEGLFFHQWDSKDVDSTKIKNIRIAINPGFKDFSFNNKYGIAINKHFVGNVDIDWMSLGKDCEVDPLLGSIVLPKTICSGTLFEAKNISNPVLVGATYNWNFGDTISTDKNAEIIFDSIGTETISLTITTAENDTIELHESVKVTECDAVGLDENKTGFSFNIQNPIQDNITGTIIAKSNTNGIITLVNTGGVTVYSQEISLTQGQNRIELNTNHLDQGMYFLRFSSELQSEAIKLVK